MIRRDGPEESDKKRKNEAMECKEENGTPMRRR